MNVSKLDQYERFDVYSRALIASKDVDPVYPLVKDIIVKKDFDPEWFIFCYVAFYNLETAIKMCNKMPSREDWNPLEFEKMRKSGFLSKFGHERRGTQRIVANQIQMFESIGAFLKEFEDLMKTAELYDVEDHVDNVSFRKMIEKLPNHGSWAAYKIAELFEKSLRYWHLSIPDLGLEDKDFRRNDGPLGGLRWIFDSGRNLENQKEGTLDFSADKNYWLEIFNRFGERCATAWGVGMGEVETCLCKWHKMLKGDYFIGHDIAEFIELEEVLGSAVYSEIMLKNFDPHFWRNLKAFPKTNNKFLKEKNFLLNSQYSEFLPKADIVQIIMDL